MCAHIREIHDKDLSLSLSTRYFDGYKIGRLLRYGVCSNSFYTHTQRDRAAWLGNRVIKVLGLGTREAESNTFESENLL